MNLCDDESGTDDCGDRSLVPTPPQRQEQERGCDNACNERWDTEVAQLTTTEPVQIVPRGLV